MCSTWVFFVEIYMIQISVIKVLSHIVLKCIKKYLNIEIIDRQFIKLLLLYIRTN